MPHHPDTEAMEKIVQGMTTKSDKIRALGKAGYARADIARFLDIRYQHVRNVLVQAEESGPAYDAGRPLPLGAWVAVSADGRLTVPMDYHQLLDVTGGGTVFLEREGNSLRLKSREQALADAQDLVARHAQGKGSLVEALITERRAEAARE